VFSVDKLREFFASLHFLADLAYLCDIFSRLNELNLNNQGDAVSIFETHSKVLAMKRKLQFYALKLRSNDLTTFPTLKDYLNVQKITLAAESKTKYSSHLIGLRENFYKYFPNDTIENTWMLDPFASEVEDLTPELSTLAQEELLTLGSDIVLKKLFKTMGYAEFWLKFGKNYPNLYEIAIKMLLKFPTSYLCEKGFSSMLFLKNKYRTRLEVEHDLRIKLSKDVPNILDVMAMKDD
jgi:zinc finger BED domain-containing protein 5/7/8/9